MSNREMTAKALNEKLWSVIEGLENKTLKVSEAKEMTNACGKIIQLALTQLQANSLGASIAVDLLEIKKNGIQLENRTQKKLEAF